MSQQLPPDLGVGRRVWARDQPWTVDGVEHAPPFTAVDLRGAGPENAGVRRTFVVPLDDIAPAGCASLPKKVREAVALRALVRLVAEALPWPAPPVAAAAGIDLWPHQLTPCLALRTGQADRVLLADEVGSGKTIAAGIAIADLVDRQPHARILVIVPASLKAQWADELQHRFGLAPRVVDAVEPAAAGVDPVVNPWAGPGVRLTSLDYVKRVDVLGGLDGLWWHLLVVDEAHHAAADSDRAHAVRALGRRALQVLLVTATPHDGDAARFEALCRLGAHETDAPLVVLRRSIRRSASTRRRTHRLECRPTEDEQRAWDLLDGYVDALRRTPRAGRAPAAPVEMLIAVLQKRAASSPAALAATVRRRRALLGDAAGPHQPGLRFEADDPAADDEGDAPVALLGIEGLRHPRLDRAWLGAIHEAAVRASRHAGTAVVLRRLLARVREPMVVFTEYRDTLAWLVGVLRKVGPIDVLHGQLGPAERQQAVSRFTRGTTRVLIATDVAAEGLNLHERCRHVVLFDLPWTPVRVEQRIGRVDRLGQQRTVHVWHVEPVSAAAARVRARHDNRAVRLADAMDGANRPGPGAAQLNHLEAVALACCRALARARVFSRHAHAAARACTRRSHPRRTCSPTARAVVSALGGRWTRALGLGPRATLALVMATFGADVYGRLETCCVAVWCDLALTGPRDRSRKGRSRWLATLGEVVATRARETVTARVEARRAELCNDVRRLAARRSTRERAVADELRSWVARHHAQPSLFGPGAPCPVPAELRALTPSAGTPADPSIDVVEGVRVVLLGVAWR